MLYVGACLKPTRWFIDYFTSKLLPAALAEVEVRSPTFAIHTPAYPPNIAAVAFGAVWLHLA